LAGSIHLEDFRGAIGDCTGGASRLANDILGLHFSKVADEACHLATFLVQQAIAGFEVAMDVVGGMEIGDPRGDVLEKGVDVLERQLRPAVEEIARQLGLALGATPHLGLELLLGGLSGGASHNVLVEVTAVAVLLKNKGTGDAGTKPGELNVLEPDVTVRHEVRMRQLGEQLDLNENLFEPGVVVADGNAFAGEMAELTSVDFVPDEQDNAFASTAEDGFLNEEGLEVVGAEGFAADSAALSLAHAWSAREELGVVTDGLGGRRRVPGVVAHKGGLGKPPDRTGRAVCAVEAVVSGAEHAKVVGIDIFMIHVILPVKGALGRGGTAKWLVACRAFGTADLEALGIGVSDDEGAVVAACVVEMC